MVAAISKQSRARPVGHEGKEIAEALNRETNPVLDEIRTAINDDPEDDTVPFTREELRPAATGSSYTTVDTTVTVTMSCRLDPSVYPDKRRGRNRAIHLRVLGYQGTPGAATDVRFQAYNQDDGEAVLGSEVIITSATSQEVLSSALTVGTATGNIKSSAKEYRLQGLRTGGTTEHAVCRRAEFVVRYV